MWSQWRNGWVIMTSNPYIGGRVPSSGTTTRGRKMVYTKQKTAGDPSCCCAA